MNMPFLRVKPFMFSVVIVLSFSVSSFVFAQTPPPPVETPEVRYPIDAAPTLDIYGVVEFISADTLQLNGLLLTVEASVNAASFFAGDWVRVRASILPNGVISVVAIDPVVSQMLPGIMMLSGIVTAINPNDSLMTVSGIQLRYDNAILNSDIEVRTPVRAFVIMTSPTTWSALAILRVDNPFDLAQPLAPLSTPEITPNTVQPPVSTPEVGLDDDSDDDNRGRGRGRGRGGDDDDD